MLEFEPELNAVEFETLSSREDQYITRSSRLPHVALSGAAGYSKRDRTTDGFPITGESLFQRQLRLSVRQLLYDGGSSMNSLKASRNDLLSQQYLEKDTIERRVVDLTEVYLDILRTQRQVALAEANIANHRETRDMLQQQADAGGSRADAALVQGRMGLATSELATQRLALAAATARYHRLVGEAPRKLFFPKIPPVPASVDSVDVSNNFAYLTATEALEAARHRHKASKGLKAPKFYFDAGVTAGADRTGISGEDNEASALIVGSWDLYKGGYNKAVEKRERYQVKKYEELVNAADLERQYQFKLAWQEREGSLNSINSLEQYAQELSQVTKDYEQQFQVGQRELLNILDVQSEAYTAKSRLLDAEFSRDVGAYRIAGVLGRATEYLLGKDGWDRVLNNKDDEDAENYASENATYDPDYRPVSSQDGLMNGDYDSRGPSVDPAESELPESEYALPSEPQATARPIKKKFRLFPFGRKR